MKTASLVFEETMDNGSPDAGSHAAAAALNRARSNTWSVGCEPMMAMTMVEELREGDGGVVLTNLGSCSSVEADSSGTSPPDAPGGGCKDPVTTFRKNWTRRNAWGNLSYAELITKAIEGSPEKRLTLSQIYDWIVHNVDYFANKGDNSSSAGWKNSIRHNLSLHSRFVRLVNDGAGKSSWWSINPDAQPLKPSRRRAATLDSKTLRKRGGGGGGGGGEPGAQRKVDFAGRSLEEVDSTTSGAGFSSSSILSPGNSRSQDDGMMAMDVGLNGSPSGYPREHGFAKAGSLSGTVPGDFRIGGHETGGAPPGSGSPPYGVRGGGGGFRMDLLGGKGPGRDPGPELCFPNHEKPNGAHGKGRLNEGARVAHGKHRRNYVPTAPLEDRAISLGFCAGNGIFYDEVFDHPPPHPVQQPSGNGYFPKRYFDDTAAGYATGLNYGGCHGNVYYPPGDAYTGGFYGNGGCFNNRAFPDGTFTGEIGSVPVPVSREVNAGGHVSGQGLRSGGFPEVQDMEQNGGSRSKDASSTGDENRELNAFPMGGYCSPSYIDMEGGKGAGVGGGGYNDDAGQGTIHREDGLQRNPSVSRFQDVEPKTETTLTDTSFFRALTTTSGYADDFPSIPDTPLRPISSPGVQSSNEPYYRSSIAAGSKYPYLPDPTTSVAKPFSQLLANRTAYPTCRNSSTVDGFYIPTTF